MIHLLIILNLLILPLLFWRPLVKFAILAGMVLVPLLLVTLTWCWFDSLKASPLSTLHPQPLETHWKAPEPSPLIEQTRRQAQELSYPLGTRYVMENNTHRTGHLLPNGVFVPDQGQ